MLACALVSAPVTALQRPSTRARAALLAPRASRLPLQGAPPLPPPPARRLRAVRGPGFCRRDAYVLHNFSSVSALCSRCQLLSSTRHAQASPRQQHSPVAALCRPAAGQLDGGSLGPSPVPSEGTRLQDGEQRPNSCSVAGGIIPCRLLVGSLSPPTASSCAWLPRRGPAANKPWPYNACTTLLIALCPSLLCLLQGSLSVPQVLLCDALFTAGAVTFLAAGLSYGLRWHPASTAYKGAW